MDWAILMQAVFGWAYAPVINRPSLRSWLVSDGLGSACVSHPPVPGKATCHVLMVVTVVQEKWKHTSGFQASACIKFTTLIKAKTNHMGRPRLRVTKDRDIGNCDKRDPLLQFPIVLVSMVMKYHYWS